MAFLSSALILDTDVSPSSLLAQLRILFPLSNGSGRSILCLIYILTKENCCLRKGIITQMKRKVKRMQLLSFNGGRNRLWPHLSQNFSWRTVVKLNDRVGQRVVGWVRVVWWIATCTITSHKSILSIFNAMRTSNVRQTTRLNGGCPDASGKLELIKVIQEF